MPTELRSGAVQQVQQIQYFDENDNPIYPYSNAELNSTPPAYSNSLVARATSRADFGATSFSNFVWIYGDKFL